MMGTPRKLRKPWASHHSRLVTRSSAATSSISRTRRWAATQPTSPSPTSNERRGKSGTPAGPANARASTRLSAASTTHTETTGTCISSAAAAAMPASTSSGSSDEETSWLRRVRVRRRPARAFSASCSRALRRRTPACSPIACSGARSASSKRRRARHHTR